MKLAFGFAADTYCCGKVVPAHPVEFHCGGPAVSVGACAAFTGGHDHADKGSGPEEQPPPHGDGALGARGGALEQW